MVPAIPILCFVHRMKISPRLALLLTLPPLLWAANAVVGRMMSASVPPLALNFMRWGVALLLLLPLARVVVALLLLLLVLLLLGWSCCCCRYCC